MSGVKKYKLKFTVRLLIDYFLIPDIHTGLSGVSAGLCGASLHMVAIAHPSKIRLNQNYAPGKNAD